MGWQHDVSTSVQKHKVYKRTAWLDSRNKPPCPRGHEAEERAKDLIQVWGMYIFGNGLVSCMCECVSLSVCNCLPVWLSVCLFVSVWMCMMLVSGWGSVVHHCDSAGFYWFSWDKRVANVRTAPGQCPKDFSHKIYCKTPSCTNTLCGRTGHWCEIFIISTISCSSVNHSKIRTNSISVSSRLNFHAI